MLFLSSRPFRLSPHRQSWSTLWSLSDKGLNGETSDGMSAFEFSVCQPACAQLHRGCTPRVPPYAKMAVTAQHEIAESRYARVRPRFRLVLPE
jgi:hypothetical protein